MTKKEEMFKKKKKKLLFIIPNVTGWFIISPYTVVFPKKHDPQGNWAHDLGVIVLVSVLYTSSTQGGCLDKVGILF